MSTDSPPGLISEDMRAIVGRPYGRTESFPVGANDIRRWDLAVRHPETSPLARMPDADVVAPPDFNPFAWGAAHTDPNPAQVEADPADVAVGAVEHHLGVAPPRLGLALNGGVAAEYTGVAIRPGDVITAESTVEGYAERTGRLGPMLMTDVATTWTNQRGERVKTHRMTLIRYRPRTDEGSTP